MRFFYETAGGIIYPTIIVCKHLILTNPPIFKDGMKHYRVVAAYDILILTNSGR